MHLSLRVPELAAIRTSTPERGTAMVRAEVNTTRIRTTNSVGLNMLR
jgi:hypothetical protein